jgi:hypothetical protein
MDIVGMYLRRYDWLRERRSEVTAELPLEHWRVRPSGVNSIAWLVWHMARCEDVGTNRLAFDLPQVLDDPHRNWLERMNVPLRHHGIRMTSAEVDELSQNVDVAALRAYDDAVRERVRKVIREADPDTLDQKPDDPDRVRRLFDEGILRPPLASWLSTGIPYFGFTRGDHLVHFGLMHSYGHYHDICIVRGLLGYSPGAPPVRWPGPTG